jgi:hypothetical protein
MFFAPVKVLIQNEISPYAGDWGDNWAALLKTPPHFFG